MGDLRRERDSSVRLRRAAIIPGPSTHRLTFVLAIGMACLMLASAADAVIWQYSTEREDLLRELSSAVNQLEAARAENARLERELVRTRVTLDAVLEASTDRRASDILETMPVFACDSNHPHCVLE